MPSVSVMVMAVRALESIGKKTTETSPSPASFSETTLPLTRTGPGSPEHPKIPMTIPSIGEKTNRCQPALHMFRAIFMVAFPGEADDVNNRMI